MFKVIQPKVRAKQDWIDCYAKARHGHIIWDGWAVDPYNPAHAYTSSHQFVDRARQFGFFKTGNKVLDIGCGNCRLGIALSELNITYVGIDPMIKCIEFCRQAYEDYANFSFNHIDLYSECSNPEGKVKPIDFTIPLGDQTVDDLVIYSVFTHLQEIEIAARYMLEIKRVLKPGGKLFCSWYRSPPNELDPYVGRTCYLESDIMTMLNGFYFDFTYGGHTSAYYDQWGIFATKI